MTPMTSTAEWIEAAGIVAMAIVFAIVDARAIGKRATQPHGAAEQPAQEARAMTTEEQVELFHRGIEELEQMPAWEWVKPPNVLFRSMLAVIVDLDARVKALEARR